MAAGRGRGRAERAAAWIAVGGLGAVLALVAAIAISGAVGGQNAVDDVRRSGTLTSAYLDAQDAFSRQDAIEDLAVDEPGPVSERNFADAAAEFTTALGVIERAGGPEDRELVRRMRPLHERYVGAMRRILASAADGELERVETLNDEVADPAQDRLQPLLDRAGPGYAATQRTEVDQLEATQDRDLERALVIVPIGIVLYALLLVVFMALRRRLDRALRRELEVSQGEARRDDVTGLGNRRQLREWLDERVARTDEPFALLLAGIDRFKEIDDTLGHSAGDELLAGVATRLRAALPAGSQVARLGGEEFAALVPATDCPAALSAAEAVNLAVDAPLDVAGLVTHVRVSIGVALFPEHAREADALLGQADLALARGRAAGRRVELYAERETDGRERVVLAGQLRAALDDGSLVAFYQPKAEVATGTVASVEALVRWQHPARGVLPPGVFLPLAEEQGLMRRVTLRMLELAAGQAAAWARAGQPLRISVNLAPANLLDVRFPDEAAGVLERAGIDAELIELEITEDTIMVDPERVLDIVARLSEQGFRFALDDFGTGYSSLAYLKRLPVQELKIDRSFVTDVVRDADDQVIVRSTIEMARNLGLRTVAEGVETREAFDRLADAGCDMVQGYLLAAPLPPAELEAWLAEYRKAPLRRASAAHGRVDLV